MHDDCLGLSGMKDCFIGLRSGGSGLTFCSAIISCSMSNSSSSPSTLPLGLCWMVRSISVSIGWMVGFLDRSPFGCYSSFKTSVLMVYRIVLNRKDVRSIAMRLIAFGLWSIALTRAVPPQNWNNAENKDKKFFFQKLKQNKIILKLN